MDILLYIKKNTRFSKNDPPLACISAPIIGGLYQMSSNPPDDMLRLARKSGKIFSIWFGDNYTVFINDPELLEEVFIKNHDTFGDRPFVPSLRIVCDNFNDLVLNDNDTWKPLRKFLDQSFTKTKLKALAPVIELQSNNLVNRLKEYSRSGEPVDPFPYLRKFTFSIIVKMVLNIDLAYEEEPNEGIMNTMFTPINELVKRIAQGAVFDTIHLLSGLYYHSIGKLLNKSLDSIRTIARNIIKEHRETVDPKNTRDVLDLMILAGYDDELMLNVIFDMLIAGVETTASSLSWLTLLMVNHQEEQDNLRNELQTKFPQWENIQATDRSGCTYTSAVIKESLRHRQLAPFSVPRIAKTDAWIGEYFVPKGTHIMGNLLAIHKNYFPDGEEFKPSRWLDDTSLNPVGQTKWVPFSLGPRVCVGYQLAHDELFVAVSKMFHNFKITSPDGSKLDETPAHGITVQPLHSHKYKFEIVN
ncbi:hypothetical protein DFA_03144 [Cavenderia fasciculata]|uniref:Cytochrome P450 family protein n=1 Tax=Cavenderia fasciculata TaxID=261658 RepID=F4PGR5_CACFS|nr:uncharacterized protein DFA_03144 [Cavenderia fasciculata]EGG24899.1 hypothetical protein DFA_03144 [Cavenderia fasciculata]|eukprot:XP_004362750.1 hypothetical protein DFA_03144 [Cavenderia fasciculata]